MRTVSVINQKGGCGKTTVAVNLAAALSELEKKVLLVDMDPQSHASIGLDVQYDAVEHTTYDLLKDPRIMVQDSVYRIDDRLHILPSSPVLSAVEQELSGREARETRLATKLARVADEYDFAIIDSPPNVGLLTFNALLAAGELIIPVEPSFFSLHGLRELTRTLDLLERETRHGVSVSILVNNVEKRTNLYRDIESELERDYGEQLFDTFISRSVRYREAARMGVSIFALPRCDRLKWEFLSVARELEERAPRIENDEMEGWIERLHGPKVVSEGVLFTLDAPGAEKVFITGEFTNWSHEGLQMERDGRDGFWKLMIELEPGEYEYRFIVDGVWIKDPMNVDSVLNEFGQENSLLIV